METLSNLQHKRDKKWKTETNKLAKKKKQQQQQQQRETIMQTHNLLLGVFSSSTAFSSPVEVVAASPP